MLDLIRYTHQNMNKMRKLVFVIEEQMEAPKVLDTYCEIDLSIILKVV